MREAAAPEPDSAVPGVKRPVLKLITLSSDHLFPFTKVDELRQGQYPRPAAAALSHDFQDAFLCEPAQPVHYPGFTGHTRPSLYRAAAEYGLLEQAVQQRHRKLRVR